MKKSLSILFLVCGVAFAGAVLAGETPKTSDPQREEKTRKIVDHQGPDGQLKVRQVSLYQDLQGGQPVVLYLDAQGRLLEVFFVSCHETICEPRTLDAQGGMLPPERSLFFNLEALISDPSFPE